MFKRIQDKKLNKVSGGGGRPACKCICSCINVCPCNPDFGDDISSQMTHTIDQTSDAASTSSSGDWRPGR